MFVLCQPEQALSKALTGAEAAPNSDERNWESQKQDTLCSESLLGLVKTG